MADRATKPERTVTRFTRQQYRKLQWLAERNDTTISAIIRAMVDRLDVPIPDEELELAGAEFNPTDFEKKALA